MEYVVLSRITPEVFREFAWFDMLRQQKRHRAPVFFAVIMAIFAGICFLMSGRVRGAVLLGGVLLGVGVILPLGWLLSFHLSLQAEIERLKLDCAPVAYTLRLTDQRLFVSNDKEQADYPWDQLLLACRLRRCICLYAAPQRAYLIPASEEQEGERLWRLICQRLPQEKIRDCQ